MSMIGYVEDQYNAHGYAHITIVVEDLFFRKFDECEKVRILPCDIQGRLVDENVFERMAELQQEIRGLAGLDCSTATWFNNCANKWFAGDFRQEIGLGTGDTPIEALKNLLVHAKESLIPKPHEEEWTIGQCIKWLEEYETLSSSSRCGPVARIEEFKEDLRIYHNLDAGAEMRKAAIQESKRVVVLRDVASSDVITKATTSSSWTDAYRNLVKTTWRTLEAREEV